MNATENEIKLNEMGRKRFKHEKSKAHPTATTKTKKLRRKHVQFHSSYSIQNPRKL